MEFFFFVQEVLSEDRIYFRAVLLMCLVMRALNAVHSSPLAGHFDVERTLMREKERFFLGSYARGCLRVW